MRCAINICRNEAEIHISNNLIQGSIPFCSNCAKLMEVHQKARDKSFFEDGKRFALEINEVKKDE